MTRGVEQQCRTKSAGRGRVFQAHNGDTGEAYYARPTRPGKVPGIVVIMHLPGWTSGSSRWRASSPIMAMRRLRRISISATAPAARHIGARVRGAGGVPDAQVVGDVAGSIAYLRAQPNASGKVGVIGFSRVAATLICACSLADIRRAGGLLGGNVVVDDPSCSTPSGRSRRST